MFPPSLRINVPRIEDSFESIMDNVSVNRERIRPNDMFSSFNLDRGELVSRQSNDP